MNCRIVTSARQAIIPKTVVGNSPLLRRCLELAATAAKAELNVLLQGETGTGKDLFARYIHDHSNRAINRLVVVDCRVAGDETLEMAFRRTAENRRQSAGFTLPGIRGTLYLDEINELSLHDQARVCSLLQDLECEVKVIAASQQDLELLAKQGRFRNDLLPLIQNLRIDLPALRERPEDILELSRYFLNCFCLWQGKAMLNSTPEFNAMLLQYPWPGNVRELANTVEQSLLTAGFAKTLFPKHLPDHIRIRVTKTSLRHPTGR